MLKKSIFSKKITHVKKQAFLTLKLTGKRKYFNKLLMSRYTASLNGHCSLKNIRNKKTRLNLVFLVIRLGFEPRTLSLKGRCSTS